MKRTIGKSSKLLINGSSFDRLCAYLEKQECDHSSFRHTVDWLHRNGVENIRVQLAKLVDLLCVCDCDLPRYIVDGETWNQHRDQPLTGPRIHGRIKWARTIKDLVSEATRPSDGGQEDHAA